MCIVQFIWVYLHPLKYVTVIVIPYHLFLTHQQETAKDGMAGKGETITRVNGNVSFFAGKHLQNF